MARGKYAARAANTRAENAQQSATQLADLLAAERLEHSRKVAELNGRIAQLQGRLDKDIRALADAEVQQAKAETQAAAKKADKDLKAAGIAVRAILREQGARLPPTAWDALDDIFGLNMRDAAAASVADRSQPGLNRRTARAAASMRDNYTTRRRAGLPVRVEMDLMTAGLAVETAKRYGATDPGAVVQGEGE